MGLVSVSLLSCYVAVLAAVFLKFNTIQPEPYMDEIFHIPQAQNYCHLKFDQWNEKITTLPGLYLISQGILQLSAFVLRSNVIDICSTLRLTNPMLLLANVFVCYGILKHLSAGVDCGIASCSLVVALVLNLFPLLFFNAFLYYTDVGSTFFVLAMYMYSLRKNHLLSAALGACAIVFRQTNVVWVAFVAGNSAFSYLQQQDVFKSKSAKIGEYVGDVILKSVSALKQLFVLLLPYGLVVLGFCIFVIKNGSIVVGDKRSHQACLHVPQVFYFSVFAVGLSSCALLSHLKDTIRSGQFFSWKKILLFGILCAFGLLMVSHFTYVHEYLISDNRHFTFYIWKRLFERYWGVRYALVPVYVASWWTMIAALSKSQSIGWICLFIFCTACVTIPQKLLEFRYFIVPYLMYRLHIGNSSKSLLFMETMIYAGINLGTFYLFLYKPFRWEHEPDSIQRFMW